MAPDRSLQYRQVLPHGIKDQVQIDVVVLVNQDLKLTGS
jgi:hypothetical protein